jgi:hypothetical protein
MHFDRSKRREVITLLGGPKPAGQTPHDWIAQSGGTCGSRAMVRCIGAAPCDFTKARLQDFERITTGNNPASWQDLDFRCAHIARISVRANSMGLIE